MAKGEREVACRCGVNVDLEVQSVGIGPSFGTDVLEVAIIIVPGRAGSQAQCEEYE